MNALDTQANSSSENVHFAGWYSLPSWLEKIPRGINIGSEGTGLGYNPVLFGVMKRAKKSLDELGVYLEMTEEQGIRKVNYNLDNIKVSYQEPISDLEKPTTTEVRGNSDIEVIRFAKTIGLRII